MTVAYADVSGKITGCYYSEQKSGWMDSNLLETNVVLIQMQGKDLLVRAEFNGHHACRIYELNTNKAILMSQTGDHYVYRHTDTELEINCELRLMTTSGGFEIRDIGYQCQRLWECGSSAGAGFKAEYATKDSHTTRCDDYLKQF